MRTIKLITGIGEPLIKPITYLQRLKQPGLPSLIYQQEKKQRSLIPKDEKAFLQNGLCMALFIAGATIRN